MADVDAAESMKKDGVRSEQYKSLLDRRGETLRDNTVSSIEFICLQLLNLFVYFISHCEHYKFSDLFS